LGPDLIAANTVIDSFAIFKYRLAMIHSCCLYFYYLSLTSADFVESFGHPVIKNIAIVDANLIAAHKPSSDHQANQNSDS